MSQHRRKIEGMFHPTFHFLPVQFAILGPSLCLIQHPHSDTITALCQEWENLSDVGP